MRKGKKIKDKVSIKNTFLNITFMVKYLFGVNKSLFLIRIPLLILDTLSAVVSMLLLRALLNELTGNCDIKIAILFAVGFAFSNFALVLIKRLVDIVDKRQLEKTKLRIRMALAKAVSKMPLSDIEDPRFRDFISRAESSDSFSGILDCITSFLGAIINVVTYIAIVLTVGPIILLLVGFVITIQLVINRLKQNSEYKWHVKQAPVYRKMMFLNDILSNLQFGKEMRVYTLQEYFLDKGKINFKKSFLPNLKKSVIEAEGLGFITEIAKVFQKLVIYIVLGVKVIFNGMAIGDFSLYLSSADKLTNCLSCLVETISNLMTCGIFAEEFRYCITLSEEKQKMYGNKVVPDDGDLSIEFCNVSFKYPNTETYVLKNISFNLNSGESMSLVGVNGAGKSTIVKLICRFYEPTEGNIFIGGINIKELSSDEYIRLIGVVFQDFKLFSFSVKENISMSVDFDEDRIKQSIDKSGLGKKIENLSNGSETYISREFDENGVEFSGGEGQKLAIARAIYRNSPIIILDEPTAALDPIAEYDVYSRFNELSKSKTAIYISQRLSSARFTDKIAVLDGGKIVEFGSHNDLILNDGVYSEMFNMQKQYYL
jgi:ABC transporter, ATP-binding protein